MNTLQWLTDHKAYPEFIAWVEIQPDQSPEAIWSSFPCGEWGLWVHQKLGTDQKLLQQVAFRAATRALGYATLALDKAGIKHELAGMSITSEEEALTAALTTAALVAALSEAVWMAREAAGWLSEGVWTQTEVATRIARLAREAAAATARVRSKSRADMEMAVWAARSAREAAEFSLADPTSETITCANDCRELLHYPKLPIN
jgi:hypothetical protein